MNYLWIRHPKKRIRHQFLARLIIFIGRIHLHNWQIHFLYGGFIYLLGGLTIFNESAMTCTWIRPKKKWIQHQIYISTTLFHESASFISRGFKLKGAWLLEIVGEFIFGGKTTLCLRLFLFSCLLISCLVWSCLGVRCVVLSCLVWSCRVYQDL